MYLLHTLLFTKAYFHESLKGLMPRLNEIDSELERSTQMIATGSRAVPKDVRGREWRTAGVSNARRW